jgi:hypothetical protein
MTAARKWAEKGRSCLQSGGEETLAGQKNSVHFRYHLWMEEAKIFLDKKVEGNQGEASSDKDECLTQAISGKVGQ